jgi:hypothetical protein
MGQVQEPIIEFTGPWNDFMVHGVTNPLTKKAMNEYQRRWPNGGLQAQAGQPQPQWHDHRLENAFV